MKNIELIINYLDKLIDQQNIKELTAVEAAEYLDKFGILKDNAKRKGLPLRRILRGGEIPHAYQINGRWFIPHSQKSAQVQVEVFRETLKSSSSSETEAKFFESEINLMLRSNFRLVNTLTEKEIPQEPGIYVIRIKDIKKIPDRFSEILQERKHDILYIGIAATSLRERFWKQELHAKGHGTFFRSLGAVLGFLPEKGSLINYKNKNNYTFRQIDIKQIIDWIENNLYVNFVICSNNLINLESILIKKYLPLLNIDKNPQKINQLILLRQYCKNVANSLPLKK